MKHVQNNKYDSSVEEVNRSDSSPQYTMVEHTDIRTHLAPPRGDVNATQNPVDGQSNEVLNTNPMETSIFRTNYTRKQ